ncbi:MULTISPECIES: hypothetical protein [Gammaproteobacteria]|uniref:hypothetical protein n=1 Tax=Gammaproteobacteria TaxID=1236 RepID=UPI002FC987C6
MFGLSESHWNIVKKAARHLNDEISKLPKSDRKKEKIVIEVITKAHGPVSVLIDRYKFVWTAGYLAGRVGSKDGDYE